MHVSAMRSGSDSNIDLHAWFINHERCFLFNYSHTVRITNNNLGCQESSFGNWEAKIWINESIDMHAVARDGISEA